MKRNFILLTACIFLFAATSDPIPNLQQPRYMVFTSGQPTVEGFDQLQAMGIKTVINVLPEDECQPGEEMIVAGNQMTYHKLPFDPQKLNLNTVRRFALLLSTEERPILFHCSTGNHAGGLWLAYRVLFNNTVLQVALNEARRIGMQPVMEDIVLKWIMDRS